MAVAAAAATVTVAFAVPSPPDDAPNANVPGAVSVNGPNDAVPPDVATVAGSPGTAGVADSCTGAEAVASVLPYWSWTETPMENGVPAGTAADGADVTARWSVVASASTVSPVAPSDRPADAPVST